MLDGKLESFFSIGGFVVGILGIVLAVVFYLKGKSKKILAYRINSNHQIRSYLSETVPELKILFNNKPISELTRTTITFTNSGNQTITSNDFAEQGKLVIKASKCFLDNEANFWINKDNKNSAVSIKLLGENLLWVYFDFLKEKESVKVTFYHEGNIDILGDLKSGKILEKMNTEDIIISFYSILIAIIIVCFALYWLFSRLFPIEGFQFALSVVIVSVFVVCLIYPLIYFIRWLLSKITSIFSRK